MLYNITLAVVISRANNTFIIVIRGKAYADKKRVMSESTVIGHFEQLSCADNLDEKPLARSSHSIAVVNNKVQ